MINLLLNISLKLSNEAPNYNGFLYLIVSGTLTSIGGRGFRSGSEGGIDPDPDPKPASSN
jgi:hypothetical protein